MSLKATVLSPHVSGRKTKAPAPAARQDKTAGRTEPPHRLLKPPVLDPFHPNCRENQTSFFDVIFLNTSSPKDDPTDERAMARQSSGHKKPHRDFRNPIVGLGSRLPSVGARFGGG